MTTITKRLEIDMGHRLLKHEGKCRNAHGHRYAFELTCTAQALDEVGRILDFGIIKSLVGGWLDSTLDHGFMVQEGDPLAVALHQENLKLMVVGFPPTAEYLAQYVFSEAQVLLSPHGVKVLHVTCYETPTSSAGYSEP